MDAPAPLRAVLVDPSLFTAPYDAALTQGLIAAGVEPLWVTRPTRRNDEQEIPAQYVDSFFYRRVDEVWQLPRAIRGVAKGAAHALGLMRLVLKVFRTRPTVVHFQWAVVPVMDYFAILLIRASCPVVLTVHDTEPFNGERVSMLQNLGFDMPLRAASRLIVHTAAGKDRLIRRGIGAGDIEIVAHGPLRLQASGKVKPPEADGGAYTVVLFGEIKPYKGLDVLIEAVALLDETQRASVRVVVAGRPRMDMRSVQLRLEELGLRDTIELRLQRLTEQEMADLFESADCFVFPYRQIDASGVYYLTKPLSKWFIASSVGVFAEDIKDGSQGELVPPENPSRLAAALARAIEQRPTAARLSKDDDWDGIGLKTRSLYEELVAPARAIPLRS